MKALTRTVEQTYAWEAFDGKRFTEASECRKYEESAFAVAKLAAQELIVKKTPLYTFCDWTGSEDNVHVYRIKDEQDLRVVNTYFNLMPSFGNTIPVTAIGHDYAVLMWECDDGYTLLGTQEEIINNWVAGLKKAFDVPESA